eukprot:7549797-Ditylum_brightwellii.AAC.1
MESKIILKLFFYKKKIGDELYSFGSLISSYNETSDESDDYGELTIRKEATNPEKDSLYNHIININCLQKAIEDNTVCKKCSTRKEIDIMQHVVDEFSKKIKATTNISILDDIILNFLKNGFLTINQHQLWKYRRNILELHQLFI